MGNAERTENERREAAVPLEREDLWWVVKRMPRAVREALQANPGGLWVAGGFVRACVAGENPSDVDLFARDPEVGAGIAVGLALAVPRGKGRLHVTKNAATVLGLGLPVQIITRWTFPEGPWQGVDSFDFTTCSAAVWWRCTDTGGAWESAVHPRFYADLAAKRLVYMVPERNEEAAGSLLRVLKFYQRGYRVTLPALARVLARTFGGVDLQALAHRRAHMGNRAAEEWLARVLLKVLHEVDPLVDPDHVFHLPAVAGPDAAELALDLEDEPGA